MSPGIRGNCVSSTRMPTEKPNTFRPPLNRIRRLVQLGELLPRPAEVSLYRFVVLSVGELGQVALPVAEPAPHLTQVAPGDSAIAPLGGRLGIEDEETIDSADHALPVLAAPVGALEVGEHARKELAARHGDVVLGSERHLASQHAAHQSLAILRGEQGAAVEGVEEDLRVAQTRPRDEMAGQPDALDGEAEALAHLHEDEAQGDGNTLAAVEHVVEEAVARIVVVVAVAREALLHEEILAQAMEASELVGGAARAVDSAGEAVQALEVGVGIEAWVLPARDGEGGSAEIDAAVGPRHQLGELQERRVSGHQQPGA